MIERMVVRAISLDVRPIACSCKKSYDKVITQAILSHPRTTLSCSRAPAAYWRKTVRKILCVCFVHRSLSDASDRTCSVRPYFFLRLFLRVHSDQVEFCVSYDFLIASSRAPIVKAPLRASPNVQRLAWISLFNCCTNYWKWLHFDASILRKAMGIILTRYSTCSPREIFHGLILDATAREISLLFSK